MERRGALAVFGGGSALPELVRAGDDGARDVGAGGDRAIEPGGLA